jgi:oxygen-independent coproporphyrinogen-3 oxidase
VIAEMDLLRQTHGRVVTQMHWGGGTPTYLDPAQITYLFNAIVTRFTVPATAEMSIEIDPRVTSRDHLKTLRFLGFNRLSVGIQDFDPKVQAAVRRFQSLEVTRRVFEDARDLGFESINADLIYGLPMQTSFSFSATLDQVIELNPDRVAAFGYAHVPSIKRQQRSFEKFLPDDSEKLDLWMLANKRFTAAGYEHIGMDHYARPEDPLVAARNDGTLHRNFQGYTTHAGMDLLGFGVSAISNVAGTYTQNYRDLSEYQACLRQSRHPVFRGYMLSNDDEIRATVIESLLCNGIVLKEDIEKRFAVVFDDYFQPELRRLNELEQDGLIDRRVARAIMVTPVGKVFVRSVARVFDAFQPSVVASKAV